MSKNNVDTFIWFSSASQNSFFSRFPYLSFIILFLKELVLAINLYLLFKHLYINQMCICTEQLKLIVIGNKRNTVNHELANLSWHKYLIDMVFPQGHFDIRTFAFRGQNLNFWRFIFKKCSWDFQSDIANKC